MKKLLTVLFLLAVLYLLFYPVDVVPEKWLPERPPALEGDFAVNDALKAAVRIHEGICFRCEDVAPDSAGYLYGGTEDGRILKLRDGEEPVVLAETGGRPLGLHHDRAGNLIVADAQKGLLRISPDGLVEVLATEHGGRPFLFTDDVDVAGDGRIYFSDASDRFGNEQYKLDFIEHGPNGRLLVYDPADGSTTLLLDRLYFANGVALGERDSFVLVNETTAHRVTRYWLKGPRAGESEIFLDNLPFYPDGISYNEDGIFWIALISPRNALLEKLAGMPFLRKVIARVPPALMPKPENYGFVLGVDASGRVRYNLQDPDGGFAQITSVQQSGDRLYLGSLYENSAAVYPLP